MRIHLLLLTLFSCSKVFACSEALKPFVDECKSQDRFQKLSDEFTTYSITMTDLKGFKIPKAIGKTSYFSSKNDLLNHTESTLTKSRDWQIWSNGQKFITELNPIYLQYSDIIKLHKNLFSTKSFFNNSPELGKLRVSSGETNPKLILSCTDKILDDKIFDLLSDYDLKSAEGYPLLVIRNIHECDDKNFSSAELYFYKGASIKVELVRWLTDLNDMLYRYENGTAPADLGPFNYLSDMRRWFLAIRPFNSGNEEVIAALLDYTSNRLGLPPLSLGDLTNPFFLSLNENRDNTNKKIQDSLSFFEGCLFERKMGPISSECSDLKL